MANNLISEVVMNKVIQVVTLLLTTFAFSCVAGDRINQSLSLDGATNVSIENQRGKVRIIGNDSDSISVEGEIDEQAKKFIFERDGASIIIKVEMPRNHNSGWNSHGSDLEIHMPKNIRMSFKGVSTDIIATDLAKSTEISVVSGNIEADALGNYVELVTVSGNIESKELSGKVTLTTVSGNISDKRSQGRLKLKAVSGNLKTRSQANEVEVSTVSGNIDLMLNEIDELVISTVSGNVDGSLSLNNSGLVKMSSVSGDIELAFKNDVQASFRLQANAGRDLVNRITREKATKAKYGPSSKLYFETGTASATVKASTVSGRIKVSK